MSDEQQIETRIRIFIVKEFLYDQNAGQLSVDASFLQQGIIDSLGTIQLVGFVEREFKVSVNQHDIVPENFDSIAKLTAYIKLRLKSS